MRLNKLSLKDKGKFCYFLGLSSHRLSVYAFANVVIWRKLFDISWAVIDNNLCLFFADKIGVFMYLPPLGGKINPKVLDEAFKIMDKFNRNKAVSRIENIEEEDIGVYQNLGYDCFQKFGDYLYLRQALVELKGDLFKSKRAGVNQFIKQYKSEYTDYSPRRKKECLGLYNEWMFWRKQGNSDPVYQGMLADNLSCLEVLLNDYRRLDICGRMVLVNGKVRGFTFGFELNKDIFCILFEVADLKIKGLSQYIFRRFCADSVKYRYINIMDDSGLDGLKRVKLSYRPKELVRNYIASRKNA